MNPTFFLKRRRELINTGTVNPGEIKEIVALELMTRIAQEETSKIEEKTRSPREYYLNLYAQCFKIVSGEDAEDVLKKDEDQG